MAACICEGAGGAYRTETVELARERLALLFLLSEDARDGGLYSSGGKSADLGEVLVELGWLLLMTGGSGISKLDRVAEGGREGEDGEMCISGGS